MACLNNSDSNNNGANNEHGDYCYTSADSYTFTTPVARASQVFAILVLLLLCLAANGLMIYAVISTRSRGSALSASSLLLINLATADLLVGTLVLPLWIVSTATLSWPLPEWLCGLTAFLTVTLMVCSILSLSAIAVDRYLNLAYPFRYPTEVTPQRLAIALGLIWAVCFLVAGLPLWGWGLYTFQPQTVPICNPSWAREVGFSIFLFLFGLTAPFFVMLAAYVRIVQIAKRHIAKIEATQAVAVMGSLREEAGDRYSESIPRNNRDNNSFVDNTGAFQNVYNAESASAVQNAAVESERTVGNTAVDGERTVGNVVSGGGGAVRNGTIGGTSAAQNISLGGARVTGQRTNSEDRGARQNISTRTSSVVNNPTGADAVKADGRTSRVGQSTHVKNKSTGDAQITNAKASSDDQNTNVRNTPKSDPRTTRDKSVHNVHSADTRAKTAEQNTNTGLATVQPRRLGAQPLPAEVHGTTVKGEHAAIITVRKTGRQPDDNNNSSPIITISCVDHRKSVSETPDEHNSFVNDKTAILDPHSSNTNNHDLDHETKPKNTTVFGRATVTSVTPETVTTGRSQLSQRHPSPSPRSVSKRTSSTVIITSDVTAGSSSSPVTASSTPLVLTPSRTATTELSSAAMAYLSPTAAVTPPLSRKQRPVVRSPSNTGPISKRVFSKSVKTANRVFVAVGVFFLCWGPYVVLNFWSVNNECEPVPYSADLLTTLLAFANSAVNPVLFLVINRDYRRRVRTLGRKCWLPCLHRKHATLTEAGRRRGSGGVFVTELDDNQPRRSGYYTERTDCPDRTIGYDNERSGCSNINNNNNDNSGGNNLLRTSGCYLGHPETSDREEMRSSRSRSAGTLSGVVPVLKRAW